MHKAHIRLTAMKLTNPSHNPNWGDNEINSNLIICPISSSSLGPAVNILVYLQGIKDAKESAEQHN